MASPETPFSRWPPHAFPAMSRAVHTVAMAERWAPDGTCSVPWGLGLTREREGARPGRAPTAKGIAL